MEVHRLYLDANILIALGEGRGEVPSLLTELASRQGSEPAFLCTSELTLAAVLVGPCRDGDDELIDRYDGWLVSGSFMEAGPVDRSVLWNAAMLRATYRSIKLPDAVHIATAMGFGCSHMLTADIRLPPLVELADQRHRSVREPVALRMLKPEADVLRDIIKRQRAF